MIVVPIAAPQASATPVGANLLVTWNQLAAAQARGLVTQYRVIYRKHGTLGEHEESAPPDADQYTISGMSNIVYCLFVVLLWFILMHCK